MGLLAEGSQGWIAYQGSDQPTPHVRKSPIESKEQRSLDLGNFRGSLCFDGELPGG